MPSVNGMTPTSVTADFAPGLAQRLLRRLGQETLYILVGFPLGLITLVLCLVGFFFGLGTVIIWVGKFQAPPDDTVPPPETTPTSPEGTLTP